MTQTLSQQEIEARLARDLPRWVYESGTIRRTWRTHSFKATLLAVNAIGHLAELAWHHPELIVNYGSVEVRLSSHDVRGITDRDFALARKIDQVLDWRPQDEGAGLEGIPTNTKAALYFREG